MDEKSVYYEAYAANERDANRQLAWACAASAILLFLVWIGYLTKLFSATRTTFIVLTIIVPILIIFLLTPLLWIRKGRNNRPGFKYFVLFTMIMIVAMLNVLIPKNTLLCWVICIVLTNHYYNPKVGKIIFFTSVILMVLCSFASMFLGEFDPHFLSGEADEANNVIRHFATSITWPDSPAGRYEYLKYLKEIGRNRYFATIVFYCIPRVFIFTIIFVISNSLNKRTYLLFRDEIKVNSVQQKVSTELEVAKSIQMNTLPETSKTLNKVEIFAELKPAREVGGDFYDYFELDDSHIAIVIGDVSGKGIPAAMFMMKTITCFKNFTRSNKTPSTILKEVNEAIFEGNTASMFVTCFLGILDTNTGILKYANAGHNPPIIGHNNSFHYLNCQSGFLLGVLKDTYLVDEEVKLEQGDLITLYTDGITEARNAEKDFYGEKRLIDFYNSKTFNSMLQLHHELKDDLDSFTKGFEQSDDITYLSLGYLGDKIYYKELSIESQPDALSILFAFTKSFVNEHKLSEKLVNDLLIVIDEIASNIMKYAYDGGKGEIFFRILYNESQRTVIMTFIDKGFKFNQLDVNNDSLKGKAEDHREGGLGILMVKNMTDTQTYEYINGKNILNFTKRVDK